ncbi:extracellular solute-binding protein [Mumia sp. zg.B21]|uniref:ABC transporter substrate-binding protein n=1 Tax=Mumia sp. zg.B21 TaxID=2855447 RepID=UPI001C6F498E|nr:extracellular solute-binding protein [Mumia sp. zg.B21]MBW9208688.1 extracellular solute-binding protein [Mumia sp. zg.B21]
MSHRPAWKSVLAVTAVSAVLALSACTPGGDGGDQESKDAKASDIETDVAAMGDLTLDVWDQEVRGGQAKQIEALNAAFQKKYPNVTIKRTSKSFDDLQKTVRLAITNDDAPDVVQVNNGRADMGQFVAAGLIQSLDGYAAVYGWDERYPESVRSTASYSKDGKTFGEGSLFGMPQVGEMVGLWYSKAKLAKLGLKPPATLDEFDNAMKAAKAAGELPVQLGNAEAWPAIHDYAVAMNQYVPRDDTRALGYGREGASWTSEENVEGADLFVSWVKDGYLTPEFNAVPNDTAWRNFAKGQGVFMIGGTWYQADLEAAMGDNLGFALPPVGPVGEPAVTGGTGLPLAITDASDHADAAAAYIDFLTDAEAMKVIQANGGLPVVDGDEAIAKGAAKEVIAAWGTVTEQDSLVPYLDWATPDMSDLMGQQLQKLSDGSVDTSAFLDAIEKTYA